MQIYQYLYKYSVCVRVRVCVYMSRRHDQLFTWHKNMLALWGGYRFTIVQNNAKMQQDWLPDADYKLQGDGLRGTRSLCVATMLGAIQAQS